MSDLREAIVLPPGWRRESWQPVGKTFDVLLPVFEAYLREHDAQQRQRIEALRQGVPHDYDWALGYSAALDDALEALGGSDE